MRWCLVTLEKFRAKRLKDRESRLRELPCTVKLHASKSSINNGSAYFWFVIQVPPFQELDLLLDFSIESGIECKRSPPTFRCFLCPANPDWLLGDNVKLCKWCRTRVEMKFFKNLTQLSGRRIGSENRLRFVFLFAFDYLFRREQFQSEIPVNYRARSESSHLHTLESRLIGCRPGSDSISASRRESFVTQQLIHRRSRKELKWSDFYVRHESEPSLGSH